MSALDYVQPALASIEKANAANDGRGCLLSNLVITET
jgi:hypothetical protein